MDFKIWLLNQLPGCLTTVVWFTFLFSGQQYKGLVKYFAKMISYYGIPKMYQPDKPVQKEQKELIFWKTLFLVTPWWFMVIPF